MQENASSNSHSAHTSALVIRLFGAFEAWVHGEPMPRLRSRKGRILLALLILRKGAEVSRERLAASLWPDSPDSQARMNLRQSLADLRAALGDQGGRLQSPASQTLRFDSQGADIDVLEFDAALQEADPTLESLERAVTLYRAPLLEDSLEESLLREREDRQEAFLAALEAFASGCFEKGEGAKAIRFLQAGIALEPLREGLYRALMRAFALERDFAAAIQVYRDLRLLLRNTLHLDPDSATVALYEELREGARERLQKFVRPDSSAPPLAASSAAPAVGFTPRPLTVLIGRDRETALIARLVETSALTTIVGPGGVGKTRLALEIARGFQSDPANPFPDGVWFVELAAVSDTEHLAPGVLSALRQTDTSPRPPIETLSNYLCGRQALLVLDNCEHLIESCAVLAERLLSEAPRLRILATSREALGLQGEAVSRLAPLPCPQAQETSDSLSLSPAVRLFAERAAQAYQDFVLNEANAPMVAAICRRLDGIPLALELAAARMKALSLAQIAERLERRFQLLDSGSRTALPRHQTLRAAVDWSYQLLSEEEKALFRRLAIFPGGFSLEGAEALCGEEETLAHLARLVDRSLIFADEEQGEQRRYRMLETLREYGLEKLREANEYETYRDKRFYWCAEFAKQAQTQFDGPERVLWGDRMNAEQPNLRLSLQEAPNPEEQAQLIAHMTRHWIRYAVAREGKVWLERALENRAALQSVTLLRILNGLACLCMLQGRYADAEVHLEEAKDLCEGVQDSLHLAYIYANLGLVTRELRKFEEALQYYAKSRYCARSENQLALLANVLLQQGNLFLEIGEYSEARRLSEEALAIKREVHDLGGIPFAQMCLGVVDAKEGDHDTACATYRTALAQLRELRELYHAFWTLHFLSRSEIARGHLFYAVRLKGALITLRDANDLLPTPQQAEEEEEDIAELRLAIGDDDFEAAYAEGSLWTLEQTMLYALEDPAKPTD